MKKGILIAFGELFLKSEGVKKIFKKRLLSNLEFFLKKEEIDFKIHSFRGRMLVETNDILKSKKIIRNVFGISWISETFFLETDLKKISDFVEKNYSGWIKKKESFALRLKLEKNIIREERVKVIDKIAKKIERKVDLDNPHKEIFIEMRNQGTFVYFEKTRGERGLPSGVEGKVLSLMSGGIDSPISSFLISKRGAENVWLHFHSFPLVSKKSIQKVESLAQDFLKYQPSLKVFFAPFAEAQKEIKLKTPAKYRILLYRRLMFKIAEKIAQKENCLSLVTGESLGQVSSQTLSNLFITREGIEIPVLSPLIGMDKEEIIKLAERTGSYETSIIPQEDCCTLFVPKKQTASGNLDEVIEIEKRIRKDKIIEDTVKKIEIEKY